MRSWGDSFDNCGSAGSSGRELPHQLQRLVHASDCEAPDPRHATSAFESHGLSCPPGCAVRPILRAAPHLIQPRAGRLARPGPRPRPPFSFPSSSLGTRDLRGSRLAAAPKRELRRSQVPKPELGNQSEGRPGRGSGWWAEGVGRQGRTTTKGMAGRAPRARRRFFFEGLPPLPLGVYSV